LRPAPPHAVPAADLLPPSLFSFFLHDTATPEIYTLSLHDALPIFGLPHAWIAARRPDWKSGWSGASAGWNPKKPSRSTTLAPLQDRKSTRLNSSHVKISYAVFCLKKKKKKKKQEIAQTYRLRRNDV